MDDPPDGSWTPPGFAADDDPARALQRLAASESLLKAITDAAHDAIVMIGADGRVEFWNPAAERMLGYGRADAMGRFVHDLLVAPADGELFRAAFPSFQATGHGAAVGRSRDLVAVRKDGQEIQVQLSLSALRYEGAWHAVSVIRDVTAARAAEAALRESEAKYRLLTESMKDVVWTLDPATLRFLYVSPSVEALRGFTPEEIIAQPMDAAMLPEVAAGLKIPMAADVEAFLASGLAHSPFRTDELQQPCKDGSFVWTEVVTAYFREPGTDRVTVQGVTREITQRKADEAKLRALAKDLETRVAQRTAGLVAANKALETFNHSISHDLRAPLRVINGFAAILARRLGDTLDPSDRHYLDEIRAASERMGDLLEELLGYAQLGRDHVRSECVPLAPVADALRATYADRIAEASASFEVVEPLAVPQADPVLLERILANLLENALTYRRSGVEPRITLTATEDAGRVVVALADNGIGIPERHLDRIFEVFERLHSQDDYPGTGIGLALVRKAAHLMGTEVTVESTEGAGSVFRIELPAAVRLT